MKKLFLVFILLLTVSVSAQYTSVYTTQPQPMPVMTRASVQPVPPPEDCPTMCKRVAMQTQTATEMMRAGMDVMTFVQCMRERCKEDCASACRIMFGSQAMDCIEKLCKPQMPPETCEQGCGRKLDECLKTTVGINIESIRAACEKLYNECVQEECGKPEQPPQTCEQGCDKEYKMCLEKTVGLNIESIRAACRKLHNECLQEKCGKPEQPPQTCEQGCDRKRDECLKTTVGISIESIRKGCENVHLKCLQDECRRPEMPECPPPHECEDKCVGGYYNCAKIARTMTAPAGRPEDVQEEYLRRCRLGISECLDECAPELPPEYQPGEKRPDCRELCARRHKECLSNGGEPMKCDEDLKYCAGLCAAPPAPEYAPVGARMPSPGEMRGLNPQPEPPSRPLSPEEMRGLNPQPEPPSWFARLMGLFRGG